MKRTLFQLLFVLLVFSEQIKATTVHTLYDFNVSLGAQPSHYIENDWNPADGDTYWISIVSGTLSAAQLQYLDFSGHHANASFITAGDLWETVSIKSPSTVPDLTGTQEIQLAIQPNYTNDPTSLFPQYISILLRLTMSDGSIWDQTKSFINNRWQKGAFSTKPHQFANPEWSAQGEFNLSNVVSWEIILVDLPTGEHSVKLHSLLMKGDYEAVDPNIPDEFNTVFPNNESSVLFLHNDSNPSDGDTQWLSHNNKLAHYYSRASYTRAHYRYEGDAEETLSIKKESQGYFDLSNANRIIARLNHQKFEADNSLVMKLTMEDGSVWKQGISLNQDPIETNLPYVDYIFPINNQGNGWKTESSNLPNNIFDPSRIKAWELVFHHLKEEEFTFPKSITFHKIIASDADDYFLNNAILSVDDWNPKDGDMEWIFSSYSSGEGLTAQFSSGGDPWDSVSIHSRDPSHVIQDNYLIDITSSYASLLPDALTFQVTMLDGSLWQKYFSLPVAGRYVFTTSIPCNPPNCPSSYGWEHIAWGPASTTVGFFKSSIVDWAVILNTPPAGHHDIKLRLDRGPSKGIPFTTY